MWFIYVPSRIVSVALVLLQLVTLRRSERERNKTHDSKYLKIELNSWRLERSVIPGIGVGLQNIGPVSILRQGHWAGPAQRLLNWFLSVSAAAHSFQRRGGEEWRSGHKDCKKIIEKRVYVVVAEWHPKSGSVESLTTSKRRGDDTLPSSLSNFYFHLVAVLSKIFQLSFFVWTT
jgi:hypothetical protein